MTGAPAQWPVLRDEATGAAMSHPPNWVPVQAPTAAAVISVAAPVSVGKPERFRPNVVLTVERVPTEAADLRVFCPAVVAGFVETLPGAYVVAVDLFPFRDDLEGRHLVVVYRQPPHAVVLSQYVVVVDAIATAVSASCSVDQYVALEPGFEACLVGFTPATREPQATR